MKEIYFHIPEYPETPTGGIKYHKIVYEYFKEKNPALTHLLGTGIISKFIDRNKFLKILSGIYLTLKVPRKSIILTSNAAFLHYSIPVLLNRIFKRHSYFLIVHHLVSNEKPEFFRMTFEKFFVRHADQIVTISLTTKNEMQKFGMLKVESVPIIPPGLDKPLKEYTGVKDKNKIFRILTVGTIEARKGIIVCLEAIRKLNHEVEWIIVGKKTGDLSYFEQFKNKIHEYDLESFITLKENLNKEELAKNYAESDVFVFPTLWEGYGMVAAEALSYGLPVIASDIPSLREIIDENVGFFFEPGNPDKLRDRIEEIMTNEDLRKSLSRNAYRKSSTFPSWEETSSKIYSVYSRMN